VTMRILLAALCVVPQGAVVELTTKDVGVVVSPAIEGTPFEPTVDVLVNRGGYALSEPRTVHTGSASEHGVVQTVRALWRDDDTLRSERNAQGDRRARGGLTGPNAKVRRPTLPQAPPVFVLGDDILDGFG